MLEVIQRMELAALKSDRAIQEARAQLARVDALLNKLEDSPKTPKAPTEGYPKGS